MSVEDPLQRVCGRVGGLHEGEQVEVRDQLRRSSGRGRRCERVVAETGEPVYALLVRPNHRIRVLVRRSHIGTEDLARVAVDAICFGRHVAVHAALGHAT